MSKWITNRLPTAEDANGGTVLVSYDDGRIYFARFDHVKPDEPWQPLPAPYVKAKRYTVGWNHNLKVWNMYCDGKPTGCLPTGLSYEDSYFAQGIADYYNKVQQ